MVINFHGHILLLPQHNFLHHGTITHLFHQCNILHHNPILGVRTGEEMTKVQYPLQYQCNINSYNGLLFKILHLMSNPNYLCNLTPIQIIRQLRAWMLRLPSRLTLSPLLDLMRFNFDQGK